MKSNATFSRILSFLLLGFIVYGTTVEAAHKHGAVLADVSGANSIANESSSDSAFGGRVGCSDCLICQLQHHFSTTLTTRSTSEPPIVISVAGDAVISSLFVHRIPATTAGRAPPFIS